MSDSARLPARRPIVVDGDVLSVDGVTADDIRRAELGRAMKAEYPGAVTCPFVVAEIRQSFEYGRLPWYRRLTTPAPKGWRR